MKNFTMTIAALLAITLDPAIRMMFTRMDEVRFQSDMMAVLSLVNQLTRSDIIIRKKNIRSVVGYLKYMSLRPQVFVSPRNPHHHGH